MNFSGVINFAKSHPVPVALGVFVTGLVLYMLMARQSAPASDNGAGAYYAAQSAQAASDNQVALGQINANAAIALGQINADTTVKNNTTWAGVSINNNDLQKALAPYQLQGQIVGAIGNVSGGGQTILTSTTSTSKGKGGGGISIGVPGVGSFGFQNGSKQSTSSSSTQTANPVSLQALEDLMKISTTYSSMH